MENSMEKINCETSHEKASEHASGKEQDNYEKIPDEVFEMILSYVPCIKYCFLVSKKFNQKVTDSTRNNRYRLVLNVDKTDIWV